MARLAACPSGEPTRNRGRSPLGRVCGNAGQLEELFLLFLARGDYAQPVRKLFGPFSYRHGHDD